MRFLNNVTRFGLGRRLCEFQCFRMRTRFDAWIYSWTSYKYNNILLLSLSISHIDRRRVAQCNGKATAGGGGGGVRLF